MDWQEQLISLYLQISNEYKMKLSNCIVRLSNHINLGFTDEEVLTIYLNGIMNGYRELKKIYEYTSRHLRDWFPQLPSYTAFVQRLNKVSHLFEELVVSLMRELPIDVQRNLPFVVDSMPIIMAQQGRRFKACVAQEIATNNGYCATKKLYYYGVKLHLMGQYATGSLPIPAQLSLTDAGTGDGRMLDEFGKDLPERSKVFADKAYQRDYQPIDDRGNFTLYTPVKKEKGQEMLDAADRLLSRAISSVRQPIESLFSWIEDKTGIQIASKVRSYNGLMTHVYGRMAAALLLLKDRFCS